MDIAIVAGEVSGDIQAARLIKELRMIRPELKVWGMGGPRMREQGAELLFDITQWALIGFWEVLKNYRKIRSVFYQFAAALRERKPAALILIDYPGFNLRLAKEIKSSGIPIIYYISPQVWAWGKGRIKQIAELIDKMVVIFPFEEEFYRRAGVPVSFVGHPIMDVLAKRSFNKEKFRREMGVGPGEQLVGILPGSREQEVKRHLPVLLKTADLLGCEERSLHFVIGAASAEIGRQIKNYQPRPKVLNEQTYDIIEASDLVLTSSGTATLETACFGTPMVVIYKLNWLTYLFLRPMISIPDIAMANVVAGRRVVPELVQYQARAESVVREALAILRSAGRQREIRTNLSKIKEKMGAPGVVQRAAAEVNSLL